jgi:hypothetical protein
MKKLFFLFALISSVASAQVGANVSHQKLVGVWVNSEDGSTITFVINADGSGNLDEETISLRIIGSKLHIGTKDETLIYSFQIEQDFLTISGGDLERPMKFSRQTAKPQPLKKLETKQHRR